MSHYNGNQTHLCKSCAATIEYDWTTGRWRDSLGNTYGPGRTMTGRPDGYHRHVPSGLENW